MKVVTTILTLLFFRLASIDGGTSNTKHYIVYMGEHSHPDSEAVVAANHGLLASVIGSDLGAQEASVHHYTKSFRGFSAMLTPDQAQKLEESNSVVSVFESKTNQLHTTNSWRFLGVDYLQQYNQLPMDSKSDIIIGVLDTGVWPESESFSDYGLGPVPSKFKGECVTGENFTLSNCNRKIIGARFYTKGFEAQLGPLDSSQGKIFRSARDSEGHGSHTASTVAGSMVANASLYGTIAGGTARGGAPSARLAIYKVCWPATCTDADVLAAMDDAIHDGVDIISISLGPNPPQPSNFKHATAIGSFHAFRKGVLVSASAGNSGLPGTAVNIAPWILTVAASSMDRDFQSDIILGNSKILKGIGLNPPYLETESYYELITGSDAAARGISSRNASFCKINTLDPLLIKGKIVVCTTEQFTDSRSEKGLCVRQGGGVGIVLVESLIKGLGLQFVVQGAAIGQEAAQDLYSYMASEKKPVAKISRTMTLSFTRPAPKMAVFSSMGPNIINPDIIKPDITGPGVNVLAAWSPVPTLNSAARSISYNIISGTSMACPHATAVAAIIKSCHPSWSPAAIKSAMMTTATILDNTRSFIVRDPNATQTTPFDYGSGHINPVAAIDPGLIYDYNSDDIINFLCSNGANPEQLANLMGQPVQCKNSTSFNLNYPSIGVFKMNGTSSLQRTVTYVGKGPTVYCAKLDYPQGINVSVTPNELKFTKAGEKLTFQVDFAASKSTNENFIFGALTWSNGIHRVRSPISINLLAA